MTIRPYALLSNPFQTNTLLCLVALATSGYAGSVQAEDTAFGLTFGQSVEAPACKGHERYPLHPTEGFCITTSSQKPLLQRDGASSGVASALFKYNDLPFWTGNRLDLVLAEGKLAGIIARTGGRTTHLSVTEDLTKKFGQPTRTVRQTAQNQLG